MPSALIGNWKTFKKEQPGSELSSTNANKSGEQTHANHRAWMYFSRKG